MVGDEPDGPLVSMDVREFVMAIGARSASPGGGTVAALTSTLVCTDAGNHYFASQKVLFIHTTNIQ